MWPTRGQQTICFPLGNALCGCDENYNAITYFPPIFKYTAGAMQPSKRGNFFHIESVQPMTEGMVLTF